MLKWSVSYPSDKAVENLSAIDEAQNEGCTASNPSFSCPDTDAANDDLVNAKVNKSSSLSGLQFRPRNYLVSDDWQKQNYLCN